jgi:hypothetical protein
LLAVLGHVHTPVKQVRGPLNIAGCCPPIQVRAIYKVALGGMSSHREIWCGDDGIVRINILEPLLDVVLPVRLKDRGLPLRGGELDLRGIHEGIIFYHRDVDLC